MDTLPYTTTVRPDTGLTSPKLGIWLFLASEVMLFGSLFSAYALLRTGAPSWPDQSAVLNVPLATLNTVILIAICRHFAARRRGVEPGAHELARLLSQRRTKATGAEILNSPKTHMFGERQYTAEDPEGHRWTFSQHVADVPPAKWGAKLSAK